GGQYTPSAAEQTVIAQSQHHQQYLDASRALPDFAELDLGETNVDNISPDDIKALQSLHREHCEVRDYPSPLTQFYRKVCIILYGSGTHCAHAAREPLICCLR
ncbi:unnamed protein product, partial [Coregonus sp. 'balchen']